jgi:hypothetical protein
MFTVIYQLVGQKGFTVYTAENIESGLDFYYGLLATDNLDNALLFDKETKAVIREIENENK